MELREIGTIGAIALLASGVTGCDSNPPSTQREITGKIQLVGGPWPDRHIAPKKASVTVTDSMHRVVRREVVTSGSFKFKLPDGQYEISARAGDSGQIACRQPQHVAIPIRSRVTVQILCDIR
ncbi:hypothetical protein GCM10023196_052640 [Actinoallomurus vinaceus]|uniref:Carboxypeptidase regulatory-like domain-containing protein n=1 Tax=Actinoallomurus vinaceus TaxID=1080074 RepID=A0ABP8UIJ0_9ACTN